MKKLLFILVLLVATFSLSAQQKTQQKVQSKDYQTITIQTNGVCEQCKKRMMDNVPQWVGVKSCTYDVGTAKLTVTYDAAKTSPAQLRTSISKLGYNADNVKADAAARAKLPSCCTSSKAVGCGHSGGCGGCGHH